MRIGGVAKGVFFAVGLLVSAAVCYGLSDAELNAVRDGCEARRNALLSYAAEFDTRHYHTLACFWLDTKLDAANASVIANCEAIINDPEISDWSFPSSSLGRIYCLFSQNSPYFPGRLTPEAEAKILEAYWAWAGRFVKIADATMGQHG